MENRTKWILWGTGTAAVGMAGVAAASYYLTRTLIGLALDRQMPKRLPLRQSRVSGSQGENRYEEERQQAAKRLELSSFEEITIKGGDGVSLIGHWHACQNARRTIVAMHGWRSSWSKDFGAIAQFWHKNGCNVLYAEQRAQNKSGGNYMGFGMLERYDCRRWVHWVNERCGTKLPVYLGGLSMGATTVLMAAGLDMPDNVHGVVADSGYTSAHAIWRHVVRNNLHLRYSFHDSLVDDLCKKKIRVGTKDYTTLKAMKVTAIPVLFIHGTDDRFVPVEMTYENYKACASKKRLLIVPGAGHCMSYFVERGNYEKAVKDFWLEFD